MYLYDLIDFIYSKNVVKSNEMQNKGCMFYILLYLTCIYMLLDVMVGEDGLL